MTVPDRTVGALASLAACLGGPIDSVEPVAGGRNSRIFRVRAARRTFALKQYPIAGSDGQDRLGTEVGALRLMAEHGIVSVPRVIAVAADRSCVLLSWIDGDPVVDVSDADIDAATHFLARIHALRHVPGAAGQPAAAEACLSGAEILRQIDARFVALHDVAADDRNLSEFLDLSFTPARDRLEDRSRARLGRARLDFDTDLAPQCRTLVPADFGFHNSMRQRDGSLAFVDFEYFGWDDPVKLTSDILLHPGFALAPEQARRFRVAAEKIYGADATFVDRLTAFLPLFGLRWVLILLNEYIPRRWAQRLRTGVSQDWEAVKAIQLSRAREALRAIAAEVQP